MCVDDDAEKWKKEQKKFTIGCGEGKWDIETRKIYESNFGPIGCARGDTIWTDK